MRWPSISEMRTRASLKRLNELELDILYARAKSKLWDKMERLRGVPDLRVSDFGTRRRHSFLWQEYVVGAMANVLGRRFTGTSNTYLAYKHDLEAIGTNAHEIPMALAAMANSDAELKQSQYRVLELWQQTYQGELLILLPDTFGTTQFLRDAPDWVADWTGQRADSKDPRIAGEEYIAWLEQRGRNPREKLFIASDSLDVDDILELHHAFSGRIRFSAGLGHAADERFPRLQSAGRELRSAAPGLQAAGRGRPPGGEAVGQSGQGAGAAGGDRALPPSLRRGRHRPTAGADLTEYLIF